MKKLYSSLSMFFFVATIGCSFFALRAEARDILAVGKSITVPAGKTEHDVVVISGSATIEGTVEGDLVVVLGDLELNGRVEGQLVVVGGKVNLGPEAEVKRDAVFVGGEVTRNPQARIEGDVRDILPNLQLPRLHGMWDWINLGLLRGRLLPPGVRWVWIATGIFLLVLMLMALIFKRPLQAGVETIEARPVGSLVAGFLVSLLFVPVLILLAVSVVGLALVPFLVSALMFAFVLGQAVIYQTVGFQFSDKLRAPGFPSLAALFLGATVFILLYMVPFLGFLILKLVTILGVGAVTLAALRRFRREKPAKPQTITFPASAAAAPATAASGAASSPVLAASSLTTAPTSSSPVAPVAPISPIPTEPPFLGAGGTGSAAATLSFTLAGFWIRFCSMVLDFVLVGGISAILQLWPLFPLLWIIYHIGFWIWKGTTIGDIILGIKCVRTDGRSLNAVVAVVRAFSSFFSALAFGLGFFWAGWDQQKQAWHDKIAGTFMVKVSKGVSLV